MKIENFLWGIAIAMIVIILAPSLRGFERGISEMNPLIFSLFRKLYNFTGSWAVAAPLFILLVCLGFYGAVQFGKFLAQKIEKEYPYAERSILIAIILLLLPHIPNQLGVVEMSYDSIVNSGLFLMIVFLIFEEFRWREEKKRRGIGEKK